MKPKRPLSSRFSEWCSPDVCELKLNVNDDFARAESAAYCGMVSCDLSCGVIVSSIRCFLGVSDVLQVEVKAMLFGVELSVFRFGLQKLILCLLFVL